MSFPIEAAEKAKGRQVDVRQGAGALCCEQLPPLAENTPSVHDKGQAASTVAG
jgi:hypothetical protein